MRRQVLALLPVILATLPAAVSAGSLTLRASAEDLATQGFLAPKTTRDGWELRFARIIATFDDVTAWQTDPPFMADGASITGTSLEFGGPFTVDLVAADEDDMVTIGTQPAAAGHWNALSWSLVPAQSGVFAGYALVLQGTATRDGQTVAFTIGSRDSAHHACGEYLGDTREGFVTADMPGALEMTLHLDHLFGRADKGADDPMNLDAKGFDQFAGSAGMQDFSLAGLHLGHVGEGHCHVTPG